MKGSLPYLEFGRRIFRIASRLTTWPPVGKVRFGSLRSVAPLGDLIDTTTSTPIDRYYAMRFLSSCAAEVHGQVLCFLSEPDPDRLIVEALETADRQTGETRTRSFTNMSDWDSLESLASGSFQSAICIDALQFAYEPAEALHDFYRILSPNGFFLATVPGISRSRLPRAGAPRPYWRFTNASLLQLGESVFDTEVVRIRVYGNVLTASALLQGLSAEQLEPFELNHEDPDFQVEIGLSAMKTGGEG